MKKKLLYIFALISTCTLKAQNPSNFYNPVINSSLSVDITDAPFNANGNDSNDDSSAINQAINFLTTLPNNGGTIIVPEGNFLFSRVQLKSNIHIRIDANATLLPILVNKRAILFEMGSKNQPRISNVSIEGVGGKFKVDFSGIAKQPTDELGARLATCNNVENFRIANCIVIDNETKFPVVNFNVTQDNNGINRVPENGLVENIELINGHYGYGVVQVQLGKNILFRNLVGQGGVTLRLESGESNAKIAAEADSSIIMDQIFGRTIFCRDGQAAVHLNPHTIDQGTVDVRNITAVACEFGVKVDAGFTNSSDETAGRLAGTFNSNSIIKNVTVTYGEKAQVRGIDFRFIPCQLRPLIGGPASDLKSYFAPSLAPTENFASLKLLNKNTLEYTSNPNDFISGDGHYSINFDESEVAHTGFLSFIPSILKIDTDDYENCDSSELPSNITSIFVPREVRNTVHSNPSADPVDGSVPVLSISENTIKNKQQIKIFPLPFKDQLTIKTNASGEVLLYNVLGNLVEQQTMKSNRLSLNTTSLSAGIYILKVITESKTFVKRIVKK